MDLIFPRSLAGKYFIHQQRPPSGMPGVLLMRGRVLGPVGADFTHFYLCEVYPADDDHIAITTETVIPLEHLVGVQFYPTQELQTAAWDGMQRMFRARQEELDKRMRQAIAHGHRRLVKLLQAQGIRIISKDEVAKLNRKMVEQAHAMKEQILAAEADGVDLAAEVEEAAGDE